MNATFPDTEEASETETRKIEPVLEVKDIREQYVLLSQYLMYITYITGQLSP